MGSVHTEVQQFAPMSTDDAIANDIKQIADELAPQIMLQKDDGVVVSGSLVEGLGNRYSDYDIYIVTADFPKLCEVSYFDGKYCKPVDQDWGFAKEFSPRILIEQISDFFGVSGHPIHILYSDGRRFLETIRDIEERFNIAVSSHDDLRDPSYSLYGIGDNLLVHKLVSGQLLQPGRILGGLDLASIKQKYCYLAYRYHNASWDVALDLSGSWLSGNIEMSCYFSRLYLEDTAWGFSHLVGLSNTNKKWLPALVRKWPSRYRGLTSGFFDLFHERCKESSQQEEFVMKALLFCDEIFRESVNILDDQSLCHSPKERTRYNANLFASLKNPSGVHKREFLWESRLSLTDAPPATEVLLVDEIDGLFDYYMKPRFAAALLKDIQP